MGFTTPNSVSFPVPQVQYGKPASNYAPISLAYTIPRAGPAWQTRHDMHYFTDIVIACKPFVVNYFFAPSRFCIYLTRQHQGHYSVPSPIARKGLAALLARQAAQAHAPKRLHEGERTFLITTPAPPPLRWPPTIDTSPADRPSGHHTPALATRQPGSRSGRAS